MTELLEQHRRQLAESLGRVDLRALAWLRASAAAIELELATTTVLPRLCASGEPGKVVKLGDVLAKSRRAVIQGEPGAGKTTLLRCLCLAHAAPESGLLERIEAGRSREKRAPSPALPGGFVPVFLRLAHFRPRRESARELSTWMMESLTEDHGEERARAVIAEVDAGRGVVCLDGLDEIGDSGTRVRVAQVIEAWAATRDGVCWVTTRSHGATALKGFDAYAILPFEHRHMHEYLVRREMARGRESSNAHRAADAWLDRFAESPATFEMLRNPLLLVIALASEEIGRRLPTERVHLYQGVIDTLVSEWNRARRPEDALRGSTGAVLDAKAVLRALAAACLQFHEDGTLGESSHRGVWTRALARHLGGGVSGADYAQEALAVLVEQAGLLVREGTEGLRLWHVSLGEYLAAIALAREAHAQPRRLLRSLGSNQGREVICMAIAWTRSVDGDPQRAEAMVTSLLECDGCGPWARLFGTTITVAVDCVLDVHPVDEASVGRVLPRVLDLIERAPLAVNAEALAALATALPRFAPAPAETRRLVGLLRAEGALLPSHVVAMMTRWVARAAPYCEEALACCEAAVTGKDDTGKEWAALGLLRVGRVSDVVCRLVVEWLGRGASSRESPREERLAEELAYVLAAGVARADALRTLLVSVPEDESTPRRHLFRTSWTDSQRTRYAAAVLLAALGHDEPAVLSALTDGSLPDRPYKEVSRSALAWLGRSSGTAQRWLGDALLGEQDGWREVAEASLLAMFERSCSRGPAADAIFGAIGRWGDRMPDAVGILTLDPNGGRFGGKRAPFHVLRGFARIDVDGLAALSQRCLGAAEFRSRWTLAAALWDEVRPREGTAREALTECLIEGVRHEELAVRVASACALEPVWDDCSGPLRRLMVSAWVAGLACAGAPVSAGYRGLYTSVRSRSQPALPVGAVACAAWRALADRLSSIDEEGGAELRTVLKGERDLQTLLAACLLFREPSTAAQCETILREELGSDNLQRVCVAYRALDTPATSDDEPRTRAAIRLMLTGWVPPKPGGRPVTREVVALFLDAPCTVDCREWEWRQQARPLLCWLAEHPEAQTLASARLDADDPSQAQRAVDLLAVALTTPTKIEQAAAAALRSSARGRARFGRVVEGLLESDDEDEVRKPLREAARRGLAALLECRLSSDELNEVHEAVQDARQYGYWSDALPDARERLLRSPVLSQRVELVSDWMRLDRSPDQWDASARQYFGVGLVALAAAVRPCVTVGEDREALHAGMVLARLGEKEPLESVAQRLLAGTAPPRLPRSADEDYYEFIHLLATDAARRLACVREPALMEDGVWRWAVIALVDLEYDRVSDAICALLLSPDGLREDLEFSRLGRWLAEHRPAWRAALEPEVGRALGRRGSRHFRHLVDWWRGMGALSPSLLATLAQRWAEWLYSDAQSQALDFATFIGGVEPLPEEAIARWRRELEDTDVPTRGRAALALAYSGERGTAVVDALIEVFLGWDMPAAGWAWERLSRAECVAEFLERRRLRARLWRSPEEAHGIASLWTSLEEASADREVTVPLALAGVESAVEEVARRSACDLLALDRTAGLAALRRVSQSSIRAAVVLFDESDDSAEELLWSALDHVEDHRTWGAVAAVLFKHRHEDPRLVDVLARVKGRLRKSTGETLWLLHALSPAAALRATIEHLASTGADRFSDGVEFLSSLYNHTRPGEPPSLTIGGHWSSFPIRAGVAEADEPRDPESRQNEHVRDTFGYASTIERTALNLLVLARPLQREIGVSPAEPEPQASRPGYIAEVEVSALMANFLDEDASRCVALWSRARGGDCSPSEVAAVRSIVDLRAGDTPGRQLARLWWRSQLPVGALLEGESREIASEVPVEDDVTALATLLGRAFPEETALRGFLAGLELADHIPGAMAPLAHLRSHAAALLVRHGRQDEAVGRAVTCGALVERDALAWRQRRSRRGREEARES